VTRQQLRLTLGYLGELVFKGFSTSGVKRTSWLPQQGTIGRILNQCMLEQILRSAHEKTANVTEAPACFFKGLSPGGLRSVFPPLDATPRESPFPGVDALEQ
jgi:hypothetical protein